MFNVPILILLYNREDLSSKLYKTLETIRPSILFINADGPKKDNPGDFDKCQNARNVFSFISWDCEVKYNYLNSNKGCKNSVSDGISWFFKNVEYGIILEDDCIPSPSFFLFCKELLERFRFDERMFHINGTNFLGDNIPVIEESYSFTLFTSIWGWATWRRAWEKYDINMKSFPNFNKTYFDDKSYSNYAKFHYQKSFEEAYFDAETNCWANAWLFTILINKGITITPKYNLVTNVGADNNSTNYFIKNRFRDNLNSLELDFPLVHPEFSVNHFLDRINFKFYRGKSLKRLYFMLKDNSVLKIIRYLFFRLKSNKFY